MKSKHLLLLTLLALFAPWAANAQQTLTVYGDGTQTTNAYVPMFGGYFDDFTKSEFVIPAAKLEEMEGGTITSMKFYISSVATYGSGWDNTHQVVFLKEIASTTLSAYSGMDDATIVFDGMFTVPASTDTEFEIEFTANTYEYQGGNLLVGIYNTDDGDYRTVNWYGESVTGASGGSSNGSSLDAITFTQRNFIPKTTFTYTAGSGVDCEKPATLEYSNVTTNSVDLTWTGGSGSYEVQYRKDSDQEWTVAYYDTDYTTRTINNLEPATNYQARVQSLCEGEEIDPETGDHVIIGSGWKTVSFTTPCDAVTTFPWSEDFESYNAGDFNAICWVNEHISGNGTQIFKVNTSTLGNNSTHQLQLPDMSNGTMTKLRLPLMTLPTGDSYLFSIDVYRNASGSSYTSEGVRVFASTNGEIEGATELGFLYRNFTQTDGGVVTAETSTGWYTYEFPIPMTGTCYIVLRGESQYGSATYMDNFKVKKILPCVKPSDPTFVSSTTTSATLSWTNGAEGQTAWQIAYSTNPNFNPDEVTPVDVTSNPGTINDLTAATTYYAYVRANCGDLGYSEWSTAYCQFATKCEAITELDENFDSYSGTTSGTTNNLPLCWNYINTSTNSTYKGYPVVYNYQSGSHSGNNHLRFLSYRYNNNVGETTSDPQPQYAILPQLENVSGLRMKLYARANSTSTNYDATFHVGIMSDPADVNTFVEIGTGYTPTSTTYELFTIPFNTYSGNGSYIAIMVEAAEGTSTYTSYYKSVFIDDITVEPIPSCVDPSDLDVVANSITTNSVQLTWTAGGTETAWDIYCTTSAEAPTAATTPTVTGTTDNPCTVSGLTASTHYYAYVRARCSDSDQSPWSAAKEFDTECETVTTFPFSQDFNSLTVANTIPLCWDNNDGTTTSPSYKWCYNTKSSSNDGSSANGHEGKCIVFDSYNNSSNNTNFLKTPVMNFPAGKIMQLNFWYKNPAGGDFSVFISTDGGVSYTTALATNLRYQSSWAEKEIVLNDYVGTENVVIVFKGTSNYGNGDAYIYLDDVTIAEAPTCIKPSALKCDSKTAHTATLSWTNGEEGQNAWQIAYSTTSDFNPDEVTPVDVTTNPATIEGLSQSTTYYAYVRANCGSEDGVSAWCNNKLTFTTLAGNVTPTGLAVDNASITSSQATASWNAVAGNTLHQSYDIYWAESTVTAVPEEPAAPNLIAGITATSQDITGLEPETSYKVWVRDNCGTDGYSSWSSAVTFSTVSVCQTPDGLAESNVTNNSATITWNTYGLTDFNLRYSTDGTTWTTVENVNSPYTFPNNLTANTAYQVQVQATCADAETWSNVLNFRTECDAITITDSYSWTENFEAPVTTASYNTSTASLIIMPYCWDNYSDNTSSYVYAKPHLLNANAGTSGYNYSSPASQVLYFYGSGNGYAALPEFTNALSELQISFKWASESNANGALTLGYITSEDDGTYNTFTAIGESFAASNASSKQMKSETVYLNEVPATATRLVFRWYYSGQWGANIDDVEVALLPSCYPVGTLAAASDVTATSAKLSWALVDDTQDAWQVCLNGDESNLIAATTHENFLLEGLTPETAYTVKVRANCGDSQGEWSNEVNFTTLEACPAPSNLTASNLTQNTADLTWNGESDSYNVKYWIPEGMNELYFEGFEDASTFSNWTRSSNVNRSTNAKHNGSNGVQFTYTTNPPLYLISPDVSAYTSESGLKLEFYYSNNSTSYTETFYVGFSSTDTEYDSFDFGDTEYSVTNMEWKRYYEDIPTGTKYFAIKYTGNNTYYMYVDDFTIGKAYPASEPQTITSNTTSAQLSNLTAGTEYEVQVQGVCDNVPGNWCDAITFTTMAEGNKVFTNATTDGKWGTADNWVPAGAPALTDEVIIRANATIESTCVAEANNITFEGTPTPTLTIEDGGQLVHNNEGVHAIVKKNIAGYSTSTTNGGWYFISSPIISSSSYDYGITPNAAGLITDNFGNSIPDGETATYDLYRFVESPGNGLEWKNYRNNSFNLDRNEGYLYANVNDVALSFEGVIRRSDQNVIAGLENTSGASFAGWNFMGNPFTCKAYSSLPYYVIDGSGTRLNMTAVLATTPIDVCTGVMVNGSGSMTFSRTPQESANNGNVQMTLSQQVVNRDGTSTGLTTIDNAIVSFNESDLLEKFVFNSSLSKLYIQQNGKDYAIVASEGQGTLPVNFKATENGTYTLNFNVEGVEMSYLHLVDNMTGNDVDLLQTPSYTFDVLTTDYESRFKLVFATGNAADDSFAFYSNGNWIINNDGQATLQVIDVTGRILNSETVNGSVSTTINAAPGVYMLRLVNGDNVKVQKVVVR